MGSLNLRNNRSEEAVRQNLISHMVEKLGYPRSLIAVEKELSLLPSLALIPSAELPKRRADIIVFAEETLRPVLLIECKAIPLTPKDARQVIGYNAFVGAPCVALANQSQVLTGYYDPKEGTYRFEKGLLTFAHLLLYSRISTKVQY